MKKIKILMYTTIFGNGGAERTMLNIINNMDLKKFMITLVVARKNGNNYLNQLKKSQSIKYINIGTEDNQDHEIYLLLSKIIEKEKPDICFAPGIFTNFILMDAIEQIDYKGKIVLRESGYVSARNLSEDAKNKLTIQYNRSDAIISITQGMKKDLIKNYKVQKNKIMVINNPVDVNRIINRSNEKINEILFSKRNGIKIITVGRLENLKNQQMLLKSFKKVKEEITDVSLIILGQGSLEESLKHLSEQLEINDSVHFVGFKENPYYYMKNSDIFVLTSLTEGFPNVIVEAMSLKIPVISTNCLTGPKEILKGGRYGYLVEINNEESLARKIIKLSKSEKKRNKIAKKAFKRVKQFDINEVIPKYEKLFEDLMK